MLPNSEHICRNQSPPSISRETNCSSSRCAAHRRFLKVQILAFGNQTTPMTPERGMRNPKAPLGKAEPECKDWTFYHANITVSASPNKRTE